MKRNNGTFVSRIWETIRGNGARRGASIEGLLSESSFEEELFKERARSDRGGGTFCMMTIDISLPRGSTAYQQAVWVLASVLHDRTRITDTRGWFRDRVAVILPYSSPGHVERIWNDILRLFQKRMPPLEADAPVGIHLTHEIYVYPTESAGKTLHKATGRFSSAAE